MYVITLRLLVSPACAWWRRLYKQVALRGKKRSKEDASERIVASRAVMPLQCDDSLAVPVYIYIYIYISVCPIWAVYIRGECNKERE